MAPDTAAGYVSCISEQVVELDFLLSLDFFAVRPLSFAQSFVLFCERSYNSCVHKSEMLLMQTVAYCLIL